ncbi:hypothetical protein FUAX_54690 (plasmid) [Fulvitalea axinellae]|uniref:Pentapeptide repeat-containing protein n=1 Tax=Fulvitalea axinellae TaxID=1182444 RepID=A0AAU9D1N0_9BACT|nr:hypothetical protein FUAX_54690 [Fulvitalea axinellae]
MSQSRTQISQEEFIQELKGAKSEQREAKFSSRIFDFVFPLGSVFSEEHVQNKRLEKRIEIPISFENCEFKKEWDVSRVKFEEEVNITHSVFCKTANFSKTTFEKKADFNNSEFQGDTSFHEIKVKKEASFESVKFGIEEEKEQTKLIFGDSIIQTTVLQNTSFKKAEFYSMSNFEGVCFIGNTSFENSEFYNQVIFDQSMFSKDKENSQNYLKFDNATFFKNVSLKGLSCHLVAFFTNTDIHEKFDLSPLIRESDNPEREDDYEKVTEFHQNIIFKPKEVKKPKSLLIKEVSFHEKLDLDLPVPTIKLISCNFGSLSGIAKSIIRTPQSFEECFFDKDIEVKNVDITEGILFEDWIFKKTVKFPDLKYEKGISFSNCEFNENVTVDPKTEKTEFLGKFEILNSEIGGNLALQGSTFHQPADFSNSKFKQNVTFYQEKDKEHGISECIVTFNKKVDFENTTFEGKAIFWKTEFNETNFENTKFQKLADFWKAIFHSKMEFNKTDFKEKIVFSFTEFKQDVSFLYSKIEDRLIMEETKFGAGLDFSRALIQGDISFFNFEPKFTSKSKIGPRYQRETYRIIKNELITQNNKIDATKFHKLEMEAYSKELKLKPPMDFQKYGRDAIERVQHLLIRFKRKYTIVAIALFNVSILLFASFIYAPSYVVFLVPLGAIYLTLLIWSLFYRKYSITNMAEITFGYFVFKLKNFRYKFGDQSINSLNRLSNLHGLSWVRALVFTVSIIIGLFSGLLYFGLEINAKSEHPWSYKPATSWSNFSYEATKNSISDAMRPLAQFAIPTHRAKFLKDDIDAIIYEGQTLPTDADRDKNYNHWFYIIDFLSRIFIGYGIYQFIAAFRKFNKG